MRSDLFERRSEKRFAGVRRAGLSHYKVAKPAHAMLNIAVWQGGCAPPSNPQRFPRRCRNSGLALAALAPAERLDPDAHFQAIS